MTRGDAAAERRARGVLLGVVGAYAAAIALLAAFGLYSPFVKTLIVPALVLAAALSSRLGAFVRDWALFLGQLILFDALRGCIYAVVNAWELPVYMGYVIRWEVALFGGVTAPTLLQQGGWQPGAGGVVERLLVVVHGSHFVFFLFFALVVWYLRREAFGRFTVAMTLVMYLGLVGYLAVPTVPPWMAAELFHVIPPIRRIAGEVYNVTLPSLQRAFDTNPIAAMPSLHAAFPTLCVLIGLRHFGGRAGWLGLYAGVVFLAIMYLGEHYFLDIAGGVLLAGVVFGVVYGTPFLVRLRQWSASRAGGSMALARTRPRLVVAVGLLAVAEGVGQFTLRIQAPFRPSVAFVRRELLGRSDVGHYILGVVAFDARDYGAAQRAFAEAVGEVRGPRAVARARDYLGRSAFANRDYGTAADALSRVPAAQLDGPGTVMLAHSYFHLARWDDAYRVLGALAARAPADPVPLYWLTRYRYLQKRISADEVRAVIRELRQNPDATQAEPLARELEGLLATPEVSTAPAEGRAPPTRARSARTSARTSHSADQQHCRGPRLSRTSP